MLEDISLDVIIILFAGIRSSYYNNIYIINKVSQYQKYKESFITIYSDLTTTQWTSVVLANPYSYTLTMVHMAAV